MSQGGGGEKTEKPTAKRQKEARKEGQVARTAELGAWIALLAFTSALPALARRQAESTRTMMEDSLAALADPEPAKALDLFGEALTGAFLTMIVLGAGVLLISVPITLAQGGFYLATKAAKPNLKKLNLIKGVQRMFGPQAWWELAKMLIRASLVSVLAYQSVTTLMPLLGGSVMSIEGLIEVGTQEAFGMLRVVAAIGVGMAVLDYVMARRRTGKQTRMSKHEVKQEHKQSEGDPHLKGAIRSRQMAVSRNRMIADVAEADVVLANPTHVAVALRYQPEKGAPKVVARGAGAVAAKIREVAADNGVPIVRDIPLARALYRSTEIPGELFAAVAHVLAFVISRRGRGAYGGTHRSPRSETQVLPEVAHAGKRKRRVPTSPPVGRAVAGAPVSTGAASSSGALTAGRSEP